ncbi:MAG TPA: Gfo/Idh/MocA family oxidoreductase [Caldilineae bacterium]|nr:Gfo/Idh/MocA family oxidoreductase [Caldilineae bacterium]
MDPLRIAVIGVGVMGQRHLEAFRRLPEAQLVAVMDVDGERARQVADRYGVPAFTELEALLDEASPEAVCVCTPDWAHREPVLAAAARGIHVLVEKPLATTLEDADAIVSAAEEAGITLMVGHILRFDPRYAEARAAVASGEIGRLTYMYGRRHNLISSGLRFQGRTTVVNFLGVHDLDMMLWCAESPVEEVYAVGGRGALADLGVDDGVCATLRFQNGAIGCLDVHWAMPPGAMLLDAEFKMIGTAGQVRIDGSFRAVQVETERAARFPDAAYAPSSPWTAGALVAQDAHFVRCVRTGERPLIDGPAARRVVALAVAIHRSLETGTVVRPEALEA